MTPTTEDPTGDLSKLPLGPYAQILSFSHLVPLFLLSTIPQIFDCFPLFYVLCESLSCLQVARNTRLPQRSTNRCVMSMVLSDPGITGKIIPTPLAANYIHVQEEKEWDPAESQNQTPSCHLCQDLKPLSSFAWTIAIGS